MDERKAVDVVHLDFQKAFDKVPHQRLLAKVRACGVAGQVANWIGNCIRDRKQRVAVNGRMSCWENVSTVVRYLRISTGTIIIHYLHQRFGQWGKESLSKFADDIKLEVM